MNGRKSLKILKISLLAIAAVALFGFGVKELWNWLIPAVFGWHAITFWQAVGLLVLSKILFGGFRGGPGRGMHWRGRMKERWAQMPPEDRDRFRRGMGGRCGPRGRRPEDGGPDAARS